MKERLLIGLLGMCLSAGVAALDLDQYRIVDLSQSYDDQTLFWPTSPTRSPTQRSPQSTRVDRA